MPAGAEAVIVHLLDEPYRGVHLTACGLDNVRATVNLASCAYGVTCLRCRRTGYYQDCREALGRWFREEKRRRKWLRANPPGRAPNVRRLFR